MKTVPVRRCLPRLRSRLGTLRALTLWAYDQTLSLALDVARALSRPVEYLMNLWPCPGEFADCRRGCVWRAHPGLPFCRTETAVGRSLPEARWFLLCCRGPAVLSFRKRSTCSAPTSTDRRASRIYTDLNLKIPSELWRPQSAAQASKYPSHVRTSSVISLCYDALVAFSLHAIFGRPPHPSRPILHYYPHLLLCPRNISHYPPPYDTILQHTDMMCSFSICCQIL